MCQGKTYQKQSTPNYVGKKITDMLFCWTQSSSPIILYFFIKKIKKPSTLLESHQNTNFKPCVYVSYNTFDFTIRYNTILTIRICLSYDSWVLSICIYNTLFHWIQYALVYRTCDSWVLSIHIYNIVLFSLDKIHIAYHTILTMDIKLLILIYWNIYSQFYSKNMS